LLAHEVRTRLNRPCQHVHYGIEVAIAEHSPSRLLLARIGPVCLPPAGSSSLTPLEGNWLINVGSGNPSNTNLVFLGSGASTAFIGGKTEITGGGSGTIVINSNTDATASNVVVNLGMAAVPEPGTLVLLGSGLASP
jgi:hypothetical protein